MDYLGPPIFDDSNIDMWKFKISSYLKALGLHVYLANNDKYIEANSQALIALRQSLSKGYISLISHCDSAFTVWNPLTSFKEQVSNYVEREPIVDETEQACFMV